ncbi:MAG: hypothetical protein RR743_03995, partial [Oscillospiraceae bacterium]
NYAQNRKPAIPQKKASPITAPAIPQVAAPNFKAGEHISHKAFGDGTISKMTPMGGDFLIEIEFSEGTKRLMLRAAAPHMKKI